MTQPTKRQIEALKMIFLGKSIYDRDPNRKHDPLARDRAGSMGGAAGRMRDTMGDQGWLQQYEGLHIRLYRDKLTSTGMQMLQAHVSLDELPDFAAKLEAQLDAENEAAAAEKAKEADAHRAIEQSAIKRRAARIAAMREVAQNYQVRLDLSDDQCLAMWMEIIEREMTQ